MEDKEFLNQRVNGFEEYIKSLDLYTLDYAEEQTGLTKDEIVRIATMIHESKATCILWAMGITQHMGATDTSTAISNLLLITGNYGRQVQGPILCGDITMFRGLVISGRCRHGFRAMRLYKTTPSGPGMSGHGA